MAVGLEAVVAHCPYALLEDIDEILQEARALPKIKETKPGIFYFKGQGFLHFHINKESHRWADIRNGENWGTSIDIPFSPTSKQRKEFKEILQKRYQKTVGD